MTIYEDKVDSQIDITGISYLSLISTIPDNEVAILYTYTNMVNISDGSCVLNPEILGIFFKKIIFQLKIKISVGITTVDDDGCEIFEGITILWMKL